MADIFISYAREDRERARKLAEILESQGWSVWWDPDIPPGETWDDVIERELDAARCVTVLWSSRSIQKEWVRAEATEGLDRRILVPALIEDVRPPLRFRQVHAASLVDWNGEKGHRGFEGLLKALMAKLGAPPQPQSPKPAPSKKQAKPKPVEKRPSAAQDLPDLAVFRDIDAPWCPEMVVLPAGEFMMGSPDTDEAAYDDEKPRHAAMIANRLAAGRYAVTFGEYDRFCERTGHDKPEDRGWGRGQRPVVNVSWNDAKAYVDWLGKQIGGVYRLLSEAEWEYACRAGTETRYSCGDSVTKKDANFHTNGTSEVGSYPANPWGLFDMHGNVWEWVEDIWHESYDGAPLDGSPWTMGGDTETRVLRGGSWDYGMRGLRSSARGRGPTRLRDNNNGFRVARTMDR